jgi:D-3-phosphoglycerate dehydrogenase
MIDRRALSKMKPGSVLINVARGPLVVEADLVEALRSGKLSAAGLDVTEVEPLPASSPLWQLSNVVITPHVGGQSRARIGQMTDFFCENLRRFQQGEPLNNLVDKKLGYPIRRDPSKSPCESN